jgi:hypothetical protein
VVAGLGWCGTSDAIDLFEQSTRATQPLGEVEVLAIARLACALDGRAQRLELCWREGVGEGLLLLLLLLGLLLGDDGGRHA